MKGYNVYKNDQFITFIPGRTKQARLDFVRNGMFIGTHMGQWRLLPNTKTLKKSERRYEYATTVGAYYRFEPSEQK